METYTVLRKWGNSLGIVIPKDLIKKNKLKPDQKVHIIITKKSPTKVKDILGMFPEMNKSTKKIMEEVDRDLDSKF
jgi:antitoxin component of MazEF toxin-antitoxin module